MEVEQSDNTHISLERLTDVQTFVVAGKTVQVGNYFGHLQWVLQEIIAAFTDNVQEDSRILVDYDQAAFRWKGTTAEFGAWAAWVEAEVLITYAGLINASDAARYKAMAASWRRSSRKKVQKRPS